MQCKSLFALITIAGSLLAAPLAQAQSFSKPVRIITSSPGSVGDTLARLLSQKLGERLGQPVVVDNRPTTSGGLIMATAAAQMPPDGHSYFITPGTVVTLVPLTSKNPGFDPLRDFAAVGSLGYNPMGLAVSAQEPINSIADLVAAVK